MNGEYFQPTESEELNRQFEIITQYEPVYSSADTDTMQELDIARYSYNDSVENFRTAFNHYAISPRPSFENDTLDEASSICRQNMEALLDIVVNRDDATIEQAAIDISHILAEELNEHISSLNYAKNSEENLELSTASKYFDIIRDEIAAGNANSTSRLVELASEIYSLELGYALYMAKRCYFD